MKTRVTSFDVFDTLLTRTWAEPHDLFVALGGRLIHEGIWRGTAGEFATARRDSERAARKDAPNGEIDLAGVHTELARRAGWTADAQRRVIGLELELEADAIRPVREQQTAVAAARQRGESILFLSDMYLPAEFIRAQLVQHGFWQTGDHLFVSHEAGVGKSRGLFVHVRAKLGASFSGWTHFGDHPHSDYSAPARLGICAKLLGRARLSYRERKLRGGGAFATEWRSRLAAASRLARLERPENLNYTEQVRWDVAASVAGPLFWAFTRWSLDQAARNGAQDAYFLARGGQIFLRIAQQLKRPSAVHCRYLLTSRLAFSGAGDRSDVAKLRELAAPNLVQHSVRQALANLALDPETMDLPPCWPRERWDENLEPRERVALADWLLAPERLRLVADALERRGALARRYLRHVGVRPDQSCALIDTGWKGTIQRNIEELLDEPGATGIVHGYYLGLDVRPEVACRGRTTGFTNVFRRLSLRRDTAHLILLEVFARGGEGPLLGFVENGDEVVPLFGPLPEEQRRDAEIFQRAILAFATHAEEYGAWPEHEKIAPVVIDNYLAFFHAPERQEAEAIGAIPHSDQMLEQRHAGLCYPMSVIEAIRACANFRQRPPCWWLAGQAELGPRPIIRIFQTAKRAKWWLKSTLTGEPD